MDNKVNNMTQNLPGNETQGKWVAVDASTLGFQFNGAPNQPMQGPDGAVYCMSESQPQYNPIGANNNYAIPTPSSIVQMPPIVQPIALVPYTSQNQPLLQYDPYSRPVEPQVAPKKPNYVKKPYKGISIVALILSLAGLLVTLFLSIASFRTNGVRPAFTVNGLDAVFSLLASFGVAVDSKYYLHRILPNDSRIPSDLLSTIVTYAVPAFSVLMMILFLVLIFKYIYKAGAAKSPRAFSFAAFINLILCISIIGMLLGMSNAETTIAERGANVLKFFTFKSSVYAGIGLVISLITSLFLFILPFFAKKNAYMLEKNDAAKRTFIIND